MEGTYVRNRFPAWIAIMAAALVLLAAPVEAASWLPPSADDLRMTAEAQAPKAAYDNRWETIRDIEARTIQPDGSVAEFHGTIYDRQLAEGQGVNYRAKVFALPDVPVEFDEPVRDTDVFEFTLEW